MWCPGEVFGGGRKIFRKWTVKKKKCFGGESVKKKKLIVKNKEHGETLFENVQIPWKSYFWEIFLKFVFPFFFCKKEFNSKKNPKLKIF